MPVSDDDAITRRQRIPLEFMQRRKVRRRNSTYVFVAFLVLMAIATIVVVAEGAIKLRR